MARPGSTFGWQGTVGRLTYDPTPIVASNWTSVTPSGWWSSESQSGAARSKIDVRILYTRDAAVAEVVYLGSAGSATGYGSSKRNKGDEYESKVGHRLAISRALEDLARRLREDLELEDE